MGQSASMPSVQIQAAHQTGRLPDEVVVALVADAKRGDREAFAQLYDHFVRDVYGFVAVRLSDREEAQDVTQAIFLRAWQSLATCRENVAFPGWLFTIARNIVTDHFRGKRIHTSPIDETVQVPAPGPTPEEMVLRHDDHQVLHAARQHCLSPREQELFDLILTGMNDKQIGITLGRGHGAVRVAHHRLMRRLRECLQRWGDLGVWRHAGD